MHSSQAENWYLSWVTKGGCVSGTSPGLLRVSCWPGLGWACQVVWEQERFSSKAGLGKRPALFTVQANSQGPGLAPWHPPVQAPLHNHPWTLSAIPERTNGILQTSTGANYLFCFCEEGWCSSEACLDDNSSWDIIGFNTKGIFTSPWSYKCESVKRSSLMLREVDWTHE